MERKIGEIFEYDDEFFQCVESSGCALCAFNETDCDDIDTGCCEVNTRRDRKSVIFKRLEKVGEPFMIGEVLYQHYKAFDIDNVCRRDGFWCIHNYKAKTLTIELTQNKKIWKKTTMQKHSNTEKIGKNLKPFSLEAAKSGKPVCTRDGRKARIICFDKITRKNYEEFKIIALVRDKDNEDIHVYNNEGRKYIDDSSVDLMMLPEKKEGWTVLRRDIGMYVDEESAKKNCTEDYFVAKVEWEE